MVPFPTDHEACVPLERKKTHGAVPTTRVIDLEFTLMRDPLTHVKSEDVVTAVRNSVPECVTVPEIDPPPSKENAPFTVNVAPLADVNDAPLDSAIDDPDGSAKETDAPPDVAKDDPEPRAIDDVAPDGMVRLDPL